MEEARDHVNEEAPYEVSDREITFFKTMVNEFVDWLHDMELLDADGEVDQDELDRTCEAMAKGYEEEEE